MRVGVRTVMSAIATLLVVPGMARAQAAEDRQVTFAKDVASILQQKCQECHRPGAMAPMSLVTYEEISVI